MAEIGTPTVDSPRPLFSLDLKGNGGLLAPTSSGELMGWVRTEIDFWSWIQDAAAASPRYPVPEAMKPLEDALEAIAQTTSTHVSSNDSLQHHFVEQCRQALERAYLYTRLPHSSTPLAKRINAFRQHAGSLAGVRFLTAVIASDSDKVRLEQIDWEGLHGTVQGLYERYQIGSDAAGQKFAAAEAAFEDLRVKGEAHLTASGKEFATLRKQLENDLKTVASAAESHRSEFATDQDERAAVFAAYSEQVSAELSGHKTAFESAQAERDTEFGELKVKHEKDMEALRKTFREELALRAPADYWEKKRKGHRVWATISGALSFAGIAGAAGGLGWHIHDLLSATLPGQAPEPWRLAVLALVGVFAVWALRLLVRMFLSHLHLLTDAGERVVMVQTYLSLTEGQQLEGKEDRHLILQALFRPAADGLVKDEGIPLSLAEAITRSGK